MSLLDGASISSTTELSSRDFSIVARVRMASWLNNSAIASLSASLGRQ